jgi:hypothetical protein
VSNPFPSQEKKQLFLTLLKVMGGHKVIVSFDGAGDSGTIDEPVLYDRNENLIDLTNATFEWEIETSEFAHEPNKWVKRNDVRQMPVGEILTEITNSMLDEHNIDWYNNDGGYGQLVISLFETPPKIKLDVSERIMTTEDHSFDYTDSGESEGDDGQV